MHSFTFAVYGALKLQTSQSAHATKNSHYWSRTSWQRHCDALANVLLGNLGSLHLCGCYIDMYHLPKHSYRPSTPLQGNVVL